MAGEGLFHDRLKPRSRRIAVGAALALVLAIRAIHPDQPIVENFVGRQIPTAMAARNLARGSGFFHPQLDTKPFPNYFVVEPPIYQAIVIALEALTGLSLTAAGRLVSAMAWGVVAASLFLLVKRRESPATAAWSVLALALFPLAMRYGRAFQPDAMALGLVMAGFACWDRALHDKAWRASRTLLALGWCLLAAGLASRAILVYLLVPIALADRRRMTWANLSALASTVLPALLWYVWAFGLVDRSGGSRASADNQAVWLGAAGVSNLIRPETAQFVLRVLCVRAFTPLGAALGVWGLFRDKNSSDRLWLAWAGATLLAMALVSAKLHHEYYWLPLAPAVAVGVGRALDQITRMSPRLGVLTAMALIGLSLAQSLTTFQTPLEWRSITAAALAVRETVPPAALVVAPEALLFQADRRGCRLEWTGPAVLRAVGEWGEKDPLERPIDLVEFYRRHGAGYFADLGDTGLDPRRKDLHDAVRRRYKVMVDVPSILIAELADPETSR